MEPARLLEHLDEQGDRLADAAARAGWDAPVPGLGWDVRALVTHTGGVHRFAADIVRTQGTSFDTPAGAAVGTGPADEELLAWFRTGHQDLVAALQAAPADLDALTFLPAPSPLHFWARRQAHETAIHRADAEHAAGSVPVFDVELAQDGIAEILLGFAARKANAISTPGALALRPTDGGAAWRAAFGGDRIHAEVSEAPADTVVVGTSGELYLWLWNRPSVAQVQGDARLAELWHDTVRVRWS